MIEEKGYSNFNAGNTMVPYCYLQAQLFADQPAWVIVPCRQKWCYWSLRTTGEWQRSGNGMDVSRLARGDHGFISGGHISQENVTDIVTGTTVNRPDLRQMCQSMPIMRK